MTKQHNNTIYLVFSSTGRQGRAVINALVTEDENASIVAASPLPESPSSQELLEIKAVTKVIKADYNDPDSIYNAIKESRATRIWFTTDFWGRTRAAEAKLGSCVVNAIIKANKSNECSLLIHRGCGQGSNPLLGDKVCFGKLDISLSPT